MAKSILQKEVWKDVSGYEGLYQVSNFGNIRSLDRRVVNHRNGSTRIAKGVNITPFDNGNGYLVVGLRKNGKRKNYYVHRIVADTFLDNPKECEYINHIDYNTKNNNVTNIEWCTQKDNVLHSIEHMKKPRTNFKLSSTGEKYIYEKHNKKSVFYRVCIKQIGIDKSFSTFEEAIGFKSEVMKKWQNQ